jgi:iron(III) transport system substrate-binding protein
MRFWQRWFVQFGVGIVIAGLVVSACSPAPGGGSTAASGSDPALAQGTSPEWDAIVEAATKEGEVVWSTTSADDWIDSAAAEFQRVYGIKPILSYTRPPDFNARYEAELAAGKQSVDIRGAGTVTSRTLDSRGLSESFGTLPVLSEPPSSWRINPFEDVEAGKGNNVFYGVWGHLFVANNELCPPENCPKSYKDLADPRFRGLILLDEPLPGGSAGTKFTSYTYLEYGEEYLRDVAANVVAVSRVSAEAPKQVARGEFPLYVSVPSPPSELFALPKPYPFRLIVPEDGMMSSSGSISLLKQAPHPNAAKVLTNFLLSKTGQQAIANIPGGPFIRKDVTPVDPDLVILSDKLFPGHPDKFEFAPLQAQYSPIMIKYLKERGLM